MIANDYRIDMPQNIIQSKKLSKQFGSYYLLNLETLQFKGMSKHRLSRDFKPAQIFRLELSNDQMNYISNRLPPGYSLVLEPKKNIPKHIIQATRKKANSYLNEDSNTHQATSKNQNQQQNPKKVTQNVNTPPNNNQKLGAQKPVVNNNNNKWVDQVSNQGVKKAAKILMLLKAHKSSWPFLLPVDVEALDIPEYYEIIKEPMDLQTIESKIKGQKYSDFSQFQSDVLKIIQNSYRFNEANENYLKITSEFENYFTKICSQTTQQQKSLNKNSKKKKKSSVSNKEFSDSVPVTLLQKKLLAQQIRRLAKQHLKGIKLIVFDHPQDQEDVFDLQKLSQKKLRDLQKYVRTKIINMQERNRINQIDKSEVSNLNQCDSEQSSFLTDSSEEN